MNHTNPILELAGLVYEEGKRRLLKMTAIFCAIAIIALAIGIILPKRYDTSTMIAVSSGTAMKPLTENRGVPVGSVEHVAITLQITEGKKILRELLQFGGWEQPGKQLDPREEAILLQKLRSRIKIDAPKEGIIRISYNDTDPDRAYKMANKLAEIYIRESDESQVRDAREAFEFIDKQVKEYSEKLSQYHQEVLQQYSGGLAAPPGSAKPAGSTSAAAPKPLPAPGAMIGPQELAALRAEKVTLEAQLAPKAPAPAPQPQPSGPDPSAQRVRQLQTELDGLLAKYTDQHPDVRRVKRELAAAQEEQQRAEAARVAALPPAKDDQTAALDDELASAARARLRDINQRIAMATGSTYQAVAGTAPRPAATVERDPDLKNIGHDTKLSELVRRYEATRDVYQDLLRRRESARVAMDLAADHRGVSLRISEPAEFPVQATGLRLSHFCLVGLVVAFLVPIGILFAIVRLDGRVRSAYQVEMMAKVPLLVSIHAVPDKSEAVRFRRQRFVAVLMLVGVAAIYVATFIIKTRAAS